MWGVVLIDKASPMQEHLLYRSSISISSVMTEQTYKDTKNLCRTPIL